MLVEYFLEVYGPKKNDPPVTGKILEALLSYDWPGNVRELQNVLHRYCMLGTLDSLSNSKERLKPQQVPPLENQPSHLKPGYPATIAETEKMMIVQALERFQWNRSKAALHLGIARRTFYRKLTKYGLI